MQVSQPAATPTLDTQRSPRLRQSAALLLVVGVLVLAYRLTAPPGVTWQHGGIDGAELTLVSALGGVAHPPGYALYTTLGGVALQLPTDSSPFVRMEWLSHLTAAAACLIVGACAWQITASFEPRARIAAALGAGAALGLSRSFWMQAALVEVYVFHTLLFAILLALCLLISRRPSAFLLLAFGHVTGLAITHHLTALLWLPGLFVLLRPRARMLRDWGWLFAGGITGLYPLLLLVLRAGHAPAADWGGIEDGLPALVDHLTGRIYQGYMQPFSLQAVIGGVGAALASLPADLTWLGVIALIAGGWALRRERRLLLAAGLWLAALGGFTGLYAAEDTAVYRLPLAAVAAIFVGVGAAWLAGRFAGGRTRLVPALIAAVLLIAHWGAVDLHADDQARQFVSAAADLPPDSLVITSSTEATFTLWYYHFVEPRLPDIIPIDRSLWRFDWYRRSLSRLYPALAPFDGALESWLRTVGDLPIAADSFVPPPPGRRSERRGMWYVLLPAS